MRMDRIVTILCFNQTHSNTPRDYNLEYTKKHTKMKPSILTEVCVLKPRPGLRAEAILERNEQMMK